VIATTGAVPEVIGDLLFCPNAIKKHHVVPARAPFF